MSGYEVLPRAPFFFLLEVGKPEVVGRGVYGEKRGSVKNTVKGGRQRPDTAPAVPVDAAWVCAEYDIMTEPGIPSHGQSPDPPAW